MHESKRLARRLSRRDLLSLTVGAGAMMIVGCGQPAAPAKPAETAKPAAPAATTAPAAPAAAPTQAPAAAAKPAEAPKPAVAEAKPAVAPATGALPKPSGPNEWVIGHTGESQCFDPSTCSSAGVATWNNRMVFDPLLTFVGEELKPEPRLAESWSRPDEQTLELKLRRGVKFHNGDEMTGEDVKYSLDLVQDEASVRRSYTRDWEGVTLTDPWTVRVRTKGPAADLFPNMSQLFIVPKKVRESMGKDAFGQKPVGTGPYKFVENVSGQRMVLEAFQDHWRGVAHPQKLTIRLIADPATRVAELKTGGVHLIAAPPLTQIKDLDQGPTQVMSLKGGKTIMYCFNTTTKPFDDVRVRQAVNYAVDRESILKNVLEGNGVLLHGPWANAAWPGYDPDLKPYPYDPAKAKQLLTEAGYGSGFETTLNLSNGSLLKDRDIAEVVANQLDEVGIKLRLLPTDSGKLNDDWKAGAFEGITQVSWAAPADAGPMIVYSFDKVKGHKVDPKLNEYVLQSRRAVDPEQRAKVLKDMGHYVNDQALWLFVHAQNEFYAKRRDLATWEPIPEYTYGSIFWYQMTPR